MLGITHHRKSQPVQVDTFFLLYVVPAEVWLTAHHLLLLAVWKLCKHLFASVRSGVDTQVRMTHGGIRRANDTSKKPCGTIPHVHFQKKQLWPSNFHLSDVCFECLMWKPDMATFNVLIMTMMLFSFEMKYQETIQNVFACQKRKGQFGEGYWEDKVGESRFFSVNSTLWSKLTFFYANKLYISCKSSITNIFFFYKLSTFKKMNKKKKISLDYFFPQFQKKKKKKGRISCSLASAWAQA